MSSWISARDGQVQTSPWLKAVSYTHLDVYKRQILGIGLMALLGQVEIKPPGASDVVFLPIYWGYDQYLIALGFALLLFLIHI